MLKTLRNLTLLCSVLAGLAVCSSGNSDITSAGDAGGIRAWKGETQNVCVQHPVDTQGAIQPAAGLGINVRTQPVEMQAPGIVILSSDSQAFSFIPYYIAPRL